MTSNPDWRGRVQTLFCVALLLVWPAADAWAQTDPVPGRLQWVTGPVQVVGPSGQRSEALTGAALREGQTGL